MPLRGRVLIEDRDLHVSKCFRGHSGGPFPPCANLSQNEPGRKPGAINAAAGNLGPRLGDPADPIRPSSAGLEPPSSGGRPDFPSHPRAADQEKVGLQFPGPWPVLQERFWVPSTQLGLMCGSWEIPRNSHRRLVMSRKLGFTAAAGTRTLGAEATAPGGRLRASLVLRGTIRAGEAPALGPGPFPVPAFPPERRSRPAEDRSSPGFEPVPGRRAVRAAGPQPPPDVADFAAPAFSCPLYLGFIDSC